MSCICERPGCDLPARHHPVVGGEVIEGWHHLCCEHVDFFMVMCATVADESERIAGLRSWSLAHRSECGPLVPA